MIAYIRPLLGKPQRLVSPFLGGGAVEVDASCRGIPVLAADIDEMLVECWQEIIKNSKKVAFFARQYWPVANIQTIGVAAKARFEWVKTKLKHPCPVQRAAAYYYLKVFSYHGLGARPRLIRRTYPSNSNMLWPGLETTAIRRLEEGYCLPNFVVKCQDWKTTLNEIRKGDAVFLDPPYPQVGNGIYGGNFDWPGFYSAVKKLDVLWVLTIKLDDYADIQLADYRKINIDWYSQMNRQHYQETIISNA